MRRWPPSVSTSSSFEGKSRMRFHLLALSLTLNLAMFVGASAWAGGGSVSGGNAAVCAPPGGTRPILYDLALSHVLQGVPDEQDALPEPDPQVRERIGFDLAELSQSKAFLRVRRKLREWHDRAPKAESSIRRIEAALDEMVFFQIPGHFNRTWRTPVTSEPNPCMGRPLRAVALLMGKTVLLARKDWNELSLDEKRVAIVHLGMRFVQLEEGENGKDSDILELAPRLALGPVDPALNLDQDPFFNWVTGMPSVSARSVQARNDLCSAIRGFDAIGTGARSGADSRLVFQVCHIALNNPRMLPDLKVLESRLAALCRQSRGNRIEMARWSERILYVNLLALQIRSDGESRNFARMVHPLERVSQMFGQVAGELERNFKSTQEYWEGFFRHYRRSLRYPIFYASSFKQLTHQVERDSLLPIQALLPEITVPDPPEDKK